MNYYTLAYYGFFGFLLATAAWCMYQMAMADWRRRIIPDAYLFPFMIIGLIITAFSPWWPHGIKIAIIGGAFGYALAALVGFAFDYYIRRKNPDATTPIGMGDIKLIFTGGLWLGPDGLAWALVLACAGGAIWGRAKKQKYIPFAPFFIIGGILSFLVNLFLL